MFQHLKRHGIAYFALLIAVSTSAYAVGNIPKDSITGREVKESSLKTVPSAKKANLLKNQVRKTLKLTSTSDPATTKAGPFTLRSECFTAVNDHVDVYLSSPEPFDFGSSGIGSGYPPDFDVDVISLENSEEASAGFPIWASTKVGNKIHSISGFVHAKLNTFGSDCIVVIDLFRTVG